MSISKRWVSVAANRERAVSLYLDLDRILTIEQIAAELGATAASIGLILREDIADADRRALASIRYSNSKVGTKNPMRGNVRAKHPRWKGVCVNQAGYLTALVDGKRQLVHRVVVATELGLRRLPVKWDVHHIDGDKTNNSLDNLAVATRIGHRAIHAMQTPKSALQSQRETIVALAVSTISRLKKTRPSS